MRRAAGWYVQPASESHSSMWRSSGLPHWSPRTGTWCPWFWSIILACRSRVAFEGEACPEASFAPLCWWYSAHSLSPIGSREHSSGAFSPSFPWRDTAGHPLTLYYMKKALVSVGSPGFQSLWEAKPPTTGFSLSSCPWLLSSLLPFFPLFPSSLTLCWR